MAVTDRLHPCCEHCAEDSIHDVPTDGHEIACNASGPCSTRPHEREFAGTQSLDRIWDLVLGAESEGQGFVAVSAIRAALTKEVA